MLSLGFFGGHEVVDDLESLAGAKLEPVDKDGLDAPVEVGDAPALLHLHASLLDLAVVDHEHDLLLLSFGQLQLPLVILPSVVEQTQVLDLKSVLGALDPADHRQHGHILAEDDEVVALCQHLLILAAGVVVEAIGQLGLAVLTGEVVIVLAAGDQII